jgi:outer membrane protein
MMKQLKLLFIAVILFAGIQSATAQTKVAHINVQELIMAMPDMKTANTSLQKLKDAHSTQLNTMIAEYEAKIKTYSTDETQVSDAVYKSRVQEVEDMKTRIQQYEQTATEELMKKQEDLYKPIIDKSKAAIQKVATAKGFQYVLDSSQGKGVIIADGTDLLADVKKELGF